LNVQPSRIDVREPLAHYGLDSVQAVSMAGELEDWLGRSLSPTLAYDYPSIHALAQHLAEKPSVTISIREDTEQKTETDLIAIIGMGCRFPGAKNTEAFWQLLRDGVDAITEVPADRWDLDAYYDPEQAVPGRMNTRWGGFLEQVDQFDSHFFKI